MIYDAELVDIDLNAISKRIEVDVKEEAVVEDPVFRMLTTMLEVNLWAEAAERHLKLIDQTALSISDRRKVQEAISITRSAKVGIAIGNVAAMHARLTRVIGSLGAKVIP